MKTSVRSLLLVPLLGMAAFLGACSTTKLDWDSRVGAYTYDQAVVELGPPEKSAQLSDGSLVADWLARRGRSGGSVGMYYGPGYYSRHYGYHSLRPYYYDPASPDFFLRLTFGPDGKLQAWKKFSR